MDFPLNADRTLDAVTSDPPLGLGAIRDLNAVPVMDVDAVLDVDAVHDLDAVKFSAVSSLFPPIGPSVPGLSSVSLFVQVYASGEPNYI